MTDSIVYRLPTEDLNEEIPSGATISFVIPAFNEERYIANTLDSIHTALQGRWSYEILVIDNGSTDRTPELVRTGGGQVLVRKGGTIGSLRNFGAARAKGDVLVFLDADITLTAAWLSNFETVVALFRSLPRVLSGSMCSIPSSPTWLERMWYAPQVDESLSHLGSAHLIIRRDFFTEIGGFDETLETGEDYDFSVRVVRSQGAIHRLSPAVVEHHGFPKTLKQFAMREMWHGTGDSKSLKAVLRSRVATAALVFLGLHILLVISLGFGSVFGSVMAVSAIVLLCVAASLRSYRAQPFPLIVANSAIYYVYFGARGLSFFPLIAGRRAKSRTHGQSGQTVPSA